jgi:hypothetical protein
MRSVITAENFTNPQRLPRSDRRNFCRTCHDDGIPAKLADRKRREKERGRQRHAVH